MISYSTEAGLRDESVDILGEEPLVGFFKSGGYGVTL